MIRRALEEPGSSNIAGQRQGGSSVELSRKLQDFISRSGASDTQVSQGSRVLCYQLSTLQLADR